MFRVPSSSAFFSREKTHSLRFCLQRDAAARFLSRKRCLRSSGSSSNVRRRRPPVGWAGDTWRRRRRSIKRKKKKKADYFSCFREVNNSRSAIKTEYLRLSRWWSIWLLDEQLVLFCPLRYHGAAACRHDSHTVTWWTLLGQSSLQPLQGDNGTVTQMS